MTKSKRIAIRVDDDVHAKLTQLAAAEDRSVSYYVERLIKDHLDSLASEVLAYPAYKPRGPRKSS